jgi:hypothetical protein
MAIVRARTGERAAAGASQRMLQRAGRGRSVAVLGMMLVVMGAAACATTGNADTAELTRIWRDRDRRHCVDTGGGWREAAGVCARGGP